MPRPKIVLKHEVDTSGNRFTHMVSGEPTVLGIVWENNAAFIYYEKFDDQMFGTGPTAMVTRVWKAFTWQVLVPTVAFIVPDDEEWWFYGFLQVTYVATMRGTYVMPPPTISSTNTLVLYQIVKK